MSRVPYVTDVQVQPHGSLYIMKRTLTRIRYKGVPPGSLYIMSRVTNVIYIQEWPLVCILNIVPYVTDIQVYPLTHYIEMYVSSPRHNRYNGCAPGSLYIMNIAPYVIDIQVFPLACST